MSNRLPVRRGGRMKRTSGGFPPGVKRWARAKELPSTSETPPDTTSDNPSPSEA